MDSVVENARGQHGGRVCLHNRVDKVLRLTRAARRDNGNTHRVAYGFQNRNIVTVSRAVAVHRRKDDFACAALFNFARPRDGFKTRADTSAVDKDFPKFLTVLYHALGIDINNDALTSKTFRSGVDQIGSFYGGRIDRNLVGSGVKNFSKIFNGTNPAADCQRHEDDVGGLTHNVDDHVAFLMTGRNIEKN